MDVGCVPRARRGRRREDEDDEEEAEDEEEEEEGGEREREELEGSCRRRSRSLKTRLICSAGGFHSSRTFPRRKKTKQVSPERRRGAIVNTFDGLNRLLTLARAPTVLLSEIKWRTFSTFFSSN